MAMARSSTLMAGSTRRLCACVEVTGLRALADLDVAGRIKGARVAGRSA